MNTLLRAPCFLLLAFAAAATAQPPTHLPEWLEADPFVDDEHDPLGMDQNDGLSAPLPSDAGQALRPTPPVQSGEVLSAIAGVREVAHDVEVQLAHGFALVDVTMRFTSTARQAAELRYRLAVPAETSVTGLEVCNARGCRRGLVEPTAAALGPYDEAVRSQGSATALPIAHAASVEDERGHAIVLRAAPVRREGRSRPGSTARTPPGDGPLTLRLRYAVPAPVRGGRVRVTMPQRGHDSRAAMARIRIRSDELSGASVDAIDAVETPVERPPNRAWEITARLLNAPDVALEAHRTRCGERECVRMRAVAVPRRSSTRDVFLLLDASPSTLGPARGRMGPALAALLSTMPADARVHALAFAARAETIAQAPAAELPLELLSRAFDRELGSATRFEAAWSLIQPALGRARRPLILLLGDGGLTTGDDSRRAIAQARAAGAELASVNLADRKTGEAIESAFHLVIEAGSPADRAARGELEPLEETLARLFAPVVAPRVRVRVGARQLDLGPLRAGEEMTWEGFADRGRASISAGRTVRAGNAPEAIALAIHDRVARAAGLPRVRLAAIAPESLADRASCGAGPRQSASGPIEADEALALVDPRRCERPAQESQPQAAGSGAPAEGRIAAIERHAGRSSLPARSLLDMLRQRIVPIARRCFRADRRGRPNYQTRAVFEFRLADREVIDAHVRGRLTPELRACLLEAVDTLEIPRFDGTISVRYPLYTAPELPPPTLTLDPEVADAVEAILDD